MSEIGAAHYPNVRLLTLGRSATPFNLRALAARCAAESDRYPIVLCTNSNTAATQVSCCFPKAARCQQILQRDHRSTLVLGGTWRLGALCVGSFGLRNRKDH